MLFINNCRYYEYMEGENPNPPANPSADYLNNPIVTTSENNEKPKKKAGVKKPIIILVVVAVAVFGVYQILKMGSSSGSQQKNYTISQESTQILLPTTLPTGFSQEGEVSKLEGEDGKITYSVNYSNGSGRITFTQSNSVSSGCIAPQQGVATSLADYKQFTPNGASEGCTFSLAKGTQNESNIYRWTNGTTQFVILIYNASVPENEINTLIDSLQKTSI